MQTRQLATRLFLADVALFVLAAVLSHHGSTSLDNIVWWIAIAGFLLLILFGLGVLVQFVFSRRRRPRRSRTR